MILWLGCVALLLVVVVWLECRDAANREELLNLQARLTEWDLEASLDDPVGTPPRWLHELDDDYVGEDGW